MIFSINVYKFYRGIKIKSAYAFDINIDLINCYNVIKTKVEDLIEALKEKEENYFKLETDNKQDYFYEIRKQYNSYKIDEQELNVKRASEFIFLNRTCFNGLYRVNKSGEFNVPFGKYKNPTICDAKNLRNLSKLFENVTFQYGDYKESNKYIDNNTFVYFDPPYRPLSVTSAFTSYTKEDFNDNNQKELAEYFINEVFAKRMINSNAKGRGAISELVITNYEEINECIKENSILKIAVSS